MKLSEAIKPISYLKAHTSEIIRQVSEEHKTMIITHNGEAKVILQDIHTYEQTQESLAMLKIIALSNESLHKRKIKPIKKTFQDLRNKIKNNP